MKGNIVIQQVLHGYNHGHRLLKSSIELSFEDRRIMDILSDSAGLNERMEIKEYISGYPLPGSNYYVIAKTWYADEMQRPGCVWTHSLLIDMADIRKLGMVSQVLDLFIRPDMHDLSIYLSNIDFIPKKFCNEEIDLRSLEYVVFTLYGTNKSKYVVTFQKGYEKEIIRVLECMNRTLREKFSFCTNTCVNRQIDKTDFTYQIFYSQNICKVYQRDDSRILYENELPENVFPVWVIRYAEVLCQQDMSDWEHFCLSYFDLDSQYEFYNKVFRLFLVASSKEETLSIKKYYDVITKLFLEQADAVKERTVDILLNTDLYNKIFQNYFIELIDVIEYVEKKKTKKDIMLLAKKITRYNKNKVYPFLKQYIHGELGKFQSEVMENTINLFHPDDLKEVSHMEKDIVMALVASCPKLIMSKDIWKESREFQCDVIGALSYSTNEVNVADLLKLVINESKQDVARAMYCKMGKQLITALYEMLKLPCSNNIQGCWDNILLEDMNFAVHHLSVIKSKHLRNRLLLKIDTYNDEIRNMLSANEWIAIFEETEFYQQNDEMQLKIAVLFLPIVLKGNDEKLGKISMPVFNVLHKKLAESAISYDEWARFEYLLPEVEPCFAWDKCLRLRKAFGIR